MTFINSFILFRNLSDKPLPHWQLKVLDFFSPVFGMPQPWSFSLQGADTRLTAHINHLILYHQFSIPYKTLQLKLPALGLFFSEPNRLKSLGCTHNWPYKLNTQFSLMPFTKHTHIGSTYLDKSQN